MTQEQPWEFKQVYAGQVPHKLGEHGWELVSVQRHFLGFTFFFKRPHRKMGGAVRV